MREVTTAPIFVRLAAGCAAPGTPPIATGPADPDLRTSVATGVDPRFPILLAGIPATRSRTCELSGVHIEYRGGGTAADAAREPEELENAYPEPSMFGTLPAYGLFARHVRGLRVRDVSLSFERDRGASRDRAALRRGRVVRRRQRRSRRTASPPGRSRDVQASSSAFRSTARPIA